MNWIVITGASSGIGAATAKKLAELKKPLWLLARREDRLKDLTNQILKSGGTARYSVLDIRETNHVDQWAQENASELKTTSALINNAGLAKGIEPFQSGLLENWRTMIETNVMGLLAITRAILPMMLVNRSGQIVNVGSVAGRWAYRGGNVYCATKAAVHSLSENLRHDLLGTGIRVTEILPGMAETEFSEVRLNDPLAAKKVYSGMRPLLADDIADAIVWSLERPQHVNIQELVIYPTDQAAPGSVHRKDNL